jgi:hypothetical protein
MQGILRQIALQVPYVVVKSAASPGWAVAQLVARRLAGGFRSIKRNLVLLWAIQRGASFRRPRSCAQTADKIKTGTATRAAVP